MNERIREFAEQSGMVKILNEHAHEYGNGQFENTEYPELEKFALSIVMKCAHVGFNAAYPGKGVDVLTAIKQHFGVDEE